MHSRLLAAVASIALATAGAAQMPSSFILPTIPGPFTQSSAPWGVGLIRYQVWMSAANWVAAVRHPMAVNQVELATQLGGRPSRNLQIEVRMANSFALSASPTFDSNFVSGETLVFPAVAGTGRAYTLPASGAGAFTAVIPFVNEFRWDGVSGVVLDIQVWDNGNGGQPYAHETRATNAAGPGMTMMWSVNNPSSTNAQFVFPGRAPQVRFTYRDGVTAAFGAGCRGDAGFVPVSTTSGGDPRIGNVTWTHELTGAAASRSAIWMLGDSRLQWAGLTLPHEMVEVGGNGCDLLVKPDLTALFITPAGVPGSGSVSLTTAVPAVGSLIGVSLFSQWLILDPNSGNRTLSMSNGLWHHFGV